MDDNTSDQFALLKSIFPFSTLRNDDLKRVNQFFERVVFLPGTTIFSDGYPAQDFYFIVSGKVKIIHHQKKMDRNLGIFGAGDHFGEESLSGDHRYQTRAFCLTDVIVLRIQGAQARALADAYPELRAALTLFQKSFNLACSEKISWRAPDEGIVLFSRRHPFFLLIRLLLTGTAFLLVFAFLIFSAFASENSFVPLLILALIELLIGVGLCAWSGIEWRNDYFILTRERVCVQKKLIGFYESRHESPVNAVLSVGVDTSFIGRLLGFGTVTVRTYTGDLQFKRLPFPYLITELLEIRHEAAALEATQAERQEIREALIKKGDNRPIRKSIPSNANGNNYADQSEQSGSFSNFMAGFFNLRTVKENSIIYRTHWWILFKKTAAPGLCLLAVVVIVLIRLIGFMSIIPDTVVYLAALLLAVGFWGWWLYQYQDWQNDVYILTDDQLIDVYKKPLGNDDRRSAPVKNIQTVEFERKGLINLMLNFGTVKIKIGNEELTFNNVYQPSEVQAEIYARYRATLENAKKNEQQKFVEWIKTYEEIQNENQQADENEKG